MKQDVLNFVKEVVINTIGNERWDKALVPATFHSGGSTSFGLIIFFYNGEEKRVLLEIEDLLVVRDKIQELREYMQTHEDFHWNKVTFTFFSDGKEDVEYLWDEEQNVDDYYWGARSVVNWLYERLALYIGEFLTENFTKSDRKWDKATFLVDKKNDFFFISGDVVLNNQIIHIFYEPSDRNQNYVPSQRVQETLQRLFENTNNGILKDKWVVSPWNHITLQISQNAMNFKNDVVFEFKPENSI
ncbi:MAG: hypothetical protein MUC49_14600 [Raineya sp.]|jgi:hypothetical protein|nr:hypothetical protein [Raineya sp.]